MRPVRRLLTLLEKMESATACGVVDQKDVDGLVRENPVTQEDLVGSEESTNKSTGGGALDKKYAEWAKEFGST